MARIIHLGRVVDDAWQILPKGATQAELTAQPSILPFALWQTACQSGRDASQTGLWLDSDELPDPAVAAQLQNVPVIAIHFPVFTDGRGFSIARLLRERYGYRGDLRAFGYVLRDQLCFLKRCGFTSFVLPENTDLQAAVASLDDFTEFYQTSVDQPQPLFRRA